MKKILSLITVMVIMFTGCGETGKGSKIGQVVKIDEASGVFCKTVEVEIIRGGFNNGSGAMGSPLYFTIEDNPKDLEIVKQAMISGDELEVNFRREFATFCRSDSHGVFSESIRVINKSDSNSNKATNVNSEVLNALILQNEALRKLLQK